jgi:hypothetical protein
MRHATVAPPTGLGPHSAVAGRESWKRAGLLVAAGCLALSIGLLVYLTDRDASRAALIPTLGAFPVHDAFGALGQWLPSFVHPLAFALFTAAVLAPGAAQRFAACAAWCVVDVGFEIGQHAAFKPQWAEALHTGAGEGSIARSVLNYFLHGSFDGGDVLAAILGSLAAAAVLQLVDHQRETHHAPHQVPRFRTRPSRPGAGGHRCTRPGQHRRQRRRGCRAIALLATTAVPRRQRQS